ncbi:CaiB/BaiF CoA-transferase family protein [Amycolatopsis sp.]|uniref:CaiB/BaiF CoA transferase family protein n=1 Tax=Amycolatopsis sp. TaxID=37632 RepID=UPI002BAD77C5|nr:CaiB/BaiF CoA-transferase family protein [Amycolatopsis sp.]HVV09278.1 CaiB/BaiF CoA-transferase family protein [Amycolatopsis sp.]
MTGALHGIRVVEMGGQGPAPFCAMMLADLGADVVRVERPARDPERARKLDSFGRGRRSVVIDVKRPAGRDLVADLVSGADVFLEGNRPGVLERLGLGPDECLAANPRLVYGRMTGWGQQGPLSGVAGHDINYIAMAGALEPIGRAGEDPVPPLSLVGDFGGGGMLLALGVCAALVERAASGRGQVVDASCVDGASLLMTVVHHLRSVGRWSDERGTNLFDSGAPFYEVYRTRDARHVSVGAIEPKFYEQLVATLGIPAEDAFPQYDRELWARRKKVFAEAFAERTRDEWCAAFDGLEACFAPVLTPAEAVAHPAHRARDAFVDVDGFAEPAPAPRFGRTPPAARRRPLPGEHTDSVLATIGRTPEEIETLRTSGVIA